jgi:DNA mismatch repair protein MLH1
MDPPLNLLDVLTSAADEERQKPSNLHQVDWNAVVTMIRAKLIDRRDMLQECFSIQISQNGHLVGMPLLLKGYTPPWTKLANFLLRLGPYVNWDEEKPCFHSVLCELASFHVPEAVPAAPPPTDEGAVEDPYIVKRRQTVERAVENVLFPALKARLVATKGLLRGIVEVANLKGLYRVFERC